MVARPSAQPGGWRNRRALCAPCRCRAVRGNGRGAQSGKSPHTTVEKDAGGAVAGAGALEENRAG